MLSAVYFNCNLRRYTKVTAALAKLVPLESPAIHKVSKTVAQRFAAGSYLLRPRGQPHQWWIKYMQEWVDIRGKEKGKTPETAATNATAPAPAPAPAATCSGEAPGAGGSGEAPGAGGGSEAPAAGGGGEVAGGGGGEAPGSGRQTPLAAAMTGVCTSCTSSTTCAACAYLD